MREILFRGKRVDNGEWVYGKLLRISETNQHFISPISSNIYDGEQIEGLIKNFDGRFVIVECVEVIPETVGQYSCLTDKNGKKIFEGDKVKMHYFFRNAYETDYGVFEDEDEIVGIVGIDEFGVYTEYNGEKWYLLSYLREPEEQLEVIGTIHEEEKL